MSLVLTNSEADVFQDCKRRWWLSIYRKLGRRYEHTYNVPTSIGTVYHEALAAYYADGTGPATWASGYYERKAAEVVTDLAVIDAEYALAQLDKESTLVITMLEGYEQYLAEEGVDENLEVLGSERHVRVQLAGGVEIQGKIDAPARYRTDPDIVLQLEHKTVGNLTDIPKTAQINTQFLTYDLLAFLQARLSGDGTRSDGVLVNMARKVKRTVRAKPPFFGRHPVRHNEAQLRAHWHHLVGIAREIQRTRARLDAGESPHQVVPPRPTRDCSWKCPFSQSCLSGMFDDGSDIDGYLAANFVEVDPLERYAKEENLSDD